MKRMMALICLSSVLYTGAAHALILERVVPCSSHALKSAMPELDEATLRAATVACVQEAALQHGKNVCESDAFAWTRPNAESMTYVASKIGEVHCTEFGGDITCAAAVAVECR